MIKNTEFSKINNSFQEKLSNDISQKKKKKRETKYLFLSINPNTYTN